MRVGLSLWAAAEGPAAEEWGAFVRVRVFSKKLLRVRGVLLGRVWVAGMRV